MNIDNEELALRYLKDFPYALMELASMLGREYFFRPIRGVLENPSKCVLESPKSRIVVVTDQWPEKTVSYQLRPLPKVLSTVNNKIEIPVRDISIGEEDGLINNLGMLRNEVLDLDANTKTRVLRAGAFFWPQEVRENWGRILEQNKPIDSFGGMRVHSFPVNFLQRLSEEIKLGFLTRLALYDLDEDDISYAADYPLIVFS